MPRKIDIPKLLRRSLIFGLLLGIIGLFVSNKIVQRFGYTGLADFIQNYVENKKLMVLAEPTKIEISMSDSGFEYLQKKRQQALDRGIQINEGDTYVDCEVTADGSTTDAQIRLKGHMTDHLEGDKWSFRIKSDEEILGMYRFSLQHPGTRNYAYEWVYHQLLKEEGIICLNYDFVQVNLRGKDLGIYALEEHFGQHVLEHNNRPPGAILRWNPNLYWEWRIDEMQGTYLDEEYSAYVSSFAEPYDRGTIRKDTALLENYLKGVSLLEAFRRGEKTTSAVFDVQLMARFHAIIDLVGGHHSLDWSDIKFFFNSETGKIEPVGYESFSVRKTERIAGQRIPDQYGGISMNYHDRLFSDPVFFEAYIINLERICDERYFSQFIQKIEPEHEKKLAILALEWPHRRFSFDPYFENIELIRHNLELPKPVHAFLEKSISDTLLTMSLSPVSDFPIELLEVEIDGKEKIAINEFLLPPKARNTFATYFSLTLTHRSKKLKNIVIKARIPGSSTIFKIDVIEMPAYKSDFGANTEWRELSDLRAHPLISFNADDTIYYFDTNVVFIDQHYLFNNGTLRLLPDQKLVFENGHIVLENAVLESYGTEDHTVLLQSNQASVMFEMNGTTASMIHTQLTGGAYGIKAQNSQMNFQHCIVADFGMDFITALHAEITMSHCYLGNVNTPGNFDRSSVQLSNVSAKHGHEFLVSNGSNVKMVSCDLVGFDKVFVLDDISTLRMWKSHLNDNQMIGSVKSSSELHAYGCDLGIAESGFSVEKKDAFGAASHLNLYRTSTDNVRRLQE